MVHGVLLKWKQLQHYCGSFMTEMIAQFLKEVLVACWNTILHVFAAIYDMGTNNVKMSNIWGISEM
jgi:hypothetical protein